MTSVGELLERDDFRLDVAAVVTVWAAPNGGDSAAVARFKRKVLASAIARTKAVEFVRQEAVRNATIKAFYEAAETEGTWDPGDLAFVADQSLDALATVAPVDFELVGRALKAENTIDILAGYAPRAANAVLADPERAQHVKRFARDVFGNSAAIKDQIMKYVGHLLTTDALLPYDGELAGVLESELNDAFGAFLDNWAPL